MLVYQQENHQNERVDIGEWLGFVHGGDACECVTTAEIGPKIRKRATQMACWMLEERDGILGTGIEDYWYEICSVAAHEHGKGVGKGG